MTCKEAQGLIRPYIADELPARELEHFIEHIRECGKCHDELETFFMIDRTVKYLDDGKEHSFNLKHLLEEDLREKEKALARRRRKRLLFACLAAAAVIAAALAALELAGFARVPGTL